MKVKGYRDLLVWQKAFALADAIYDATLRFPKEETYGLTSQLRRCAVSVPSNIAEGASRQGTKEYLNFLNIAKGSLAEMETQILLADKRRFFAEGIAQQLLEKCAEIDRMLLGLISKLKEKSTKYLAPST